MPGEPQITLLFAPQRIDVGVPEAAHIGGDARVAHVRD
jgi:hypothetical protein